MFELKKNFFLIIVFAFEHQRQKFEFSPKEQLEVSLCFLPHFEEKKMTSTINLRPNFLGIIIKNADCKQKQKKVYQCQLFDKILHSK